MNLNGTTYSFVRAGEAVSVEHMGPDGYPCRDALVYTDRVLGVIPGALVEVAREVLETRI